MKGYKGEQFQRWLEQIGTDPEVSNKFKNIYKLYKDGFYEYPARQWFWEEREEKEFQAKIDRVVANEIAARQMPYNAATYFLYKKE